MFLKLIFNPFLMLKFQIPQNALGIFKGLNIERINFETFSSFELPLSYHIVGGLGKFYLKTQALS